MRRWRSLSPLGTTPLGTTRLGTTPLDSTGLGPLLLDTTTLDTTNLDTTALDTTAVDPLPRDTLPVDPLPRDTLPRNMLVNAPFACRRKLVDVVDRGTSHHANTNQPARQLFVSCANSGGQVRRGRWRSIERSQRNRCIKLKWLKR